VWDHPICSPYPIVPEASTIMASAAKLPPPPEIEYPDSDGESMSDHDLQYKWIVVIKEGLVVQFDDDPDVYVAGNLLWYPVEGEPTIRGAPDVLIAFGRPEGNRGSYKQWEEGGIAPQVVFEVRSPGNRPGELGRKFQFYEQYGVEEYYLYDPFSGSLEGWRRRGRALKKIARMRGFVSPRLGIRFEPGRGRDNLTIIGRSGQPFITPLETSRRRAEAEQRAAAAERRRDAEAERRVEAERHAETERQRAERLAARLRELGIEPD
jgi:Uma2 family endonuclease